MDELYQALDHVTLEWRRRSPITSDGSRLRGHEFHYSRASASGDASFAFDVRRGAGIRDGMDGLIEYRTLGTYAHVHAESGAFDRFVDSL